MSEQEMSIRCMSRPSMTIDGLCAGCRRAVESYRSGRFVEGEHRCDRASVMHISEIYTDGEMKAMEVGF